MSADEYGIRMIKITRCGVCGAPIDKYSGLCLRCPPPTCNCDHELNSEVGHPSLTEPCKGVVCLFAGKPVYCDCMQYWPSRASYRFSYTRDRLTVVRLGFAVQSVDCEYEPALGEGYGSVLREITVSGAFFEEPDSLPETMFGLALTAEEVSRFNALRLDIETRLNDLFRAQREQELREAE